MKTFFYALLVLSLMMACSLKPNNEMPTSTAVSKIQVGVFDRNGDSPYCIIDAMEAVAIDSGMRVRTVSAADIVSGAADDIDVFILPGGSGSSEMRSLGEQGKAYLQRLVKQQGKAILGICAGAYALSNTPNYNSLSMSGLQAIDIEHDHRGHGLVKFELTAEGQAIFPELKGQQLSYCQYYEGPVLIDAQDSLCQYISLATMLSDVHLVEGSPKQMTNNRPFITLTELGKGRTASVVGHPENTPGMRWMVPRMIRVLMGQPLISYNALVVRPHIYTQEYLYTPARLLAQDKYIQGLRGSSKAKKAAMQAIVDTYAWSAKKWIPPMLRDKDFEVRLLAAELIVFLERTDAIADLQAAVDMEPVPHNKLLLQRALDKLVSVKAW